MLKNQRYLFVLAIIISQSFSKHLGKNQSGFDVFTIELADPPQERFAEIAIYYKDNIAEILKAYHDTVPDFFRIYLETFSSLIELF
jgi:hypothetical protein